ncbi:hypothetical protein [Streptomyces sp. NPDC050564]|uniref:hypothetical protein n=1 Tax=Streptomyces sp. NPDC050564 TaxID=3365631 RepID=UPI00379B4BAF
MPRIKLANWYGDKAPGEELDVDDVTLKALSRDGLVAEVVETPQEKPAAAPAAEEPAAQPETGRRKR